MFERATLLAASGKRAKASEERLTIKTMTQRSRPHLLLVAAARLEREGRQDLAKGMRAAAKAEASARAEGRGHQPEDDQRAEQYRTLFTMLTPSNATDRLKEAMLQRAYDLLWDGDAQGCDALIEFLPSADVERMLDAWSRDAEGTEPRSGFYENH